MIITKTPLRISFSGGGTDLPSFYQNCNYGAVVSTSIDSYIYVLVKKHTSLFKERIRLNYSETELVDTLKEIKNPIIRECLRYLKIEEPIYITTIADCPGSSGLGSSSSFCVGLLNALYKYKGASTSAGRLAEEAAHIEIDVLKRPIGKQDHYAAAYGGMNYFRFNAEGSVEVRPLSLNKEKHSLIFDHMLCFWTKKTRPAESILHEQDKKNHQNQNVLLKMRDQADFLMDAFTHNRFTLHKFGSIIHEGWELKRSLTEKISSTHINDCYETARKHGAIGGKILGAGGGGFLTVFAERKFHKNIINALTRQGLLLYPFSYGSLGTTAMRVE